MSSQCSYNLRLTFILFLALFSLIEIRVNAFGIQKVCGKILADALASICVNGFNNRIKSILQDKQKEDRTIAPIDDTWYYRLKDVLKEPQSEKSESSSESIEINHSSTEEVLTSEDKEFGFSSSTRIVDDCCTYGCSYSDILMYCS